MKEYFNGFSTQDLVDMRRNDEKRKEKVEMEKEIERLHSIIKEVREYIKDKYAIILADDLFLDHDERIERKRLLEILEILDKVNNDE